MPVQGWEKGDIVRDMVIQPGGPEVPRKPGSRRTDRTIKVAAAIREAAAEATNQSRRDDRG
jgi:hypothetical protein